MPVKVRVALLAGHLPPAGGREEFIRLATDRVDRDLFDLRLLFYDRNPANVEGAWHKSHRHLIQVVRTPDQFNRAWSGMGGTDILQSHIDPTKEFMAAWCPAKVQVIHNLHQLTKAEYTVVDELVCVSRWVQANQDPNHVGQLIYNGVDDYLFGSEARSSEPLRSKLGIPIDAVVVGWVGYVTPVKQLEQFLAVASHLLPKYPKLHFVMVGGVPPWGSPQDKDYLDQIKLAASLLPDGARVLFLDECQGRPLASLYQMMDVYLQLSKFETFSRTVAEAMMCRTVCVVKQGSGMTELVGTHGFAVASKEEAAQAVEYLIQNSALRSAMADRSRQRALANFSASAQILEFEKLWLRLARKKKVIPETYSGYEVKQKLVPQDLLRPVLVIAPTVRDYDFAAYLKKAAEALGVRTFDITPYREYSSVDPTVRTREFEGYRLKIMDMVKNGSYALVIGLKMMEWTLAQVQELRKASPPTKFILWMTDITAEGAEQYWFGSLVKEMDLLFATGRGVVKRYRQAGVKAHWATEGFCEAWFKPQTVDKSVDIGFVGSLNSLGCWPGGLCLGYQYPSRLDILSRAQQSFGSSHIVQFWGDKDPQVLPVKGPLWNSDFARFVSSCRVLLSPSGFSTPTWREEFYTSNRLYLYLGCGGFVFNQYFDGIEDFFQNHVDLVWFHSLDEMEELLRYYLVKDRDGVRSRIAASGYQKAFRRFRMDCELKKVLSISYGRPFFEGYGFTD